MLKKLVLKVQVDNIRARRTIRSIEYFFKVYQQIPKHGTFSQADLITDKFAWKRQPTRHANHNSKQAITKPKTYNPMKCGRKEGRMEGRDEQSR